ncbi:hypothetical protein BJY52DRAFT_1221018 [Lactarius psammicola]|nr:hypothetical protein BJY52DRAFT_1221018 [Lactarius psammicola]
MFSICGARGDLSAMQDGPPVEYESDALDDDVTFLYKPSGCLERDGSFCIITKEFEENCDAAHLVPMGKGDEYIREVVEDRSPLYGGTVPSISRRVDQRPTNMDMDHSGTDYITLQHFKEPASHNPVSAAALAATRNLHSPYTLFASGSNVDTLFQGTGSSLPPAIILDYVYGVAAYNCWGRRDNVHAETLHVHKEGGRNGKSMDELILVLMHFSGTTPQEVAKRREKRMEEERMAQETSRSRVMGWMKHADVGGQ